ncbi:zinc finger protein [Medicago truncatula]|uniref:Zinc finger protein n=1 Tax=Medicago truncatula TaxID=3880 RepID=A0A072TX58_MEDTR|nr:zinc finger protein [Medicago truncatula]
MELENQNQDSNFPFWKPISRKFQPDSPFFAIGNLERELLVKQVALEFELTQEKEQLEDFIQEDGREVFCPIAGCGARLASIEDFENHYYARHTASCSYECLVEGCGLKFKSYKSRQHHLVDKHKFPTSFEFFKKALPSKKHRIKSQRKKPSQKEDTSGMMEVENAAMDDLVSAVSRLNTSDTAPSSISFGRRNTKGMSFVPRAVQRGKGSNSGSSVTKK